MQKITTLLKICPFFLMAFQISDNPKTKTMKKEIIHSNQAPNPIGPYSQAVMAGDLLFVSGQIAINP